MKRIGPYEPCLAEKCLGDDWQATHINNVGARQQGLCRGSRMARRSHGEADALESKQGVGRRDEGGEEVIENGRKKMFAWKRVNERRRRCNIPGVHQKKMRRSTTRAGTCHTAIGVATAFEGEVVNEIIGGRMSWSRKESLSIISTTLSLMMSLT